MKGKKSKDNVQGKLFLIKESDVCLECIARGAVEADTKVAF